MSYFITFFQRYFFHTYSIIVSKNCMQTQKKGTAFISNPYSGWDYFLPGMDYTIQAHKKGRCSRPQRDSSHKYLLRQLHFVSAKVLHCPLCPRYKMTQGTDSQELSLSQGFCLSLETSECFFSTAFLIFEMEQTLASWG